ncbi:MAG: hypothetical protein IKB98_01640 [Clostridia bacterium]|nr:hypothetical protein [Clostridia bacterium]
MRETSITKRQPLSLGDNALTFKVGEEESICTDCNLPVKKCNGDCKRFKEEFKKLKKKQKENKL